MVVSPIKRINCGDTTVLPITYIYSRFCHILNNNLYSKMLFKFILKKIAFHSKFIGKLFKTIFSKQAGCREDCSISAIVTLCWRYHHLYLYNLLLKIVPSLVTEDGAFCHMNGEGVFQHPL